MPGGRMIDIPGVGLDQDGMRMDCMAQNGVKLVTDEL